MTAVSSACSALRDRGAVRDRVLGRRRGAAVAATEVCRFQDPRDRRVQRAGRPRRPVRHRQRLRRLGPGLRGRRPDLPDRRRRRRGATRSRTSRRSPRPADGVLVGDIGDNLAARDSVRLLRVPFGDGGPDGRRPTTYELIYPGGARDAETLLVHPETGQVLRRLQGRSSAGIAVRRARAALRRRPQPAARRSATCPAGHRRRVLPGRPALRAARLRARGRLHLPRARVGRRRHPAGRRSRARASRSTSDGPRLRQLRGPAGAVLRIACRGGSQRADRAARRRAAHRPAPDAVIAGRRAGAGAEPDRAAVAVAARRLGSASWSSCCSVLRCAEVRADAAAAQDLARRARLDPAPGRRAASSTSTSTATGCPTAGRQRVQGPGDPAGVGGRLDHAVRQRPPAGGRHRRRRPAAVPLPPRLADPPRRREVRPGAGVRPRR